MQEYPLGRCGSARPWWQNRHVLFRFVRDVVVHEMSRLRPTALIDRAGLGEETVIDGGGLGADSLEIMALATALTESLQLARSGVEDRLLVRRTLGAWVDTAAAGFEHCDDLIGFRTSGSTGVPKATVHELAELEEEASLLAALFQGRRRLVVMVPHHHIYGFLFGILLPHNLGVPAIDRAGAAPLGLAGLLEPGDLIIGFPDFWRSFVHVLPMRGLGVLTDVHGTTSTAPCPPELAWAVADVGLERLVQIYGSTETGGFGWRDTADGPFQLLPVWERILGDDTRLARRLADGRLRIEPCLDTLSFTGPDLFLIGRRLDARVQVAGVNVSLTHVAEVLRRHPKVRDAVVRPMSAGEGDRLKTFIVPFAAVDSETDRQALQDELTAYVDASLTMPERPRAFSFGAQLPTSDMGKPADWPVVAP